MQSQRTLQPPSVPYQRPDRGNPSELHGSRMSSWDPVNLHRMPSSFSRVYPGSPMSEKPSVSRYQRDNEHQGNQPCPTSQTVTGWRKQGLRGGKGRTRIGSLACESSRSWGRQVMEAILVYIACQQTRRWLTPVELGSLTIYCGDGGG